MTKTALLLDFGGVVSKTLFETHSDSERVLGLAAGTLTWRGPFDPTRDPLWQAMQRGDIHEHDYWTTRVRETGALLGQSWTALTDFTRRVRGADPNAAIRPEAITVLATLKARGIRTAVLTNGLDHFYGADVRGRMAVLAYMDEIVDATYTGVFKPDPRAYRLALDALQVIAADVLFVDDQPEHTAGARAVGIDALNFDVTKPAESWAAIARSFMPGVHQ